MGASDLRTDRVRHQHHLPGAGPDAESGLCQRSLGGPGPGRPAPAALLPADGQRSPVDGRGGTGPQRATGTVGTSSAGDLIRGADPPAVTELEATSTVVSALTSLVGSARSRRGLHRRPKSPLVRRLTRSASEGLTNLAAAIAGCRRRPALRVEWASHLAGESGRELCSWQNLRVALGFVLGALKMRTRDLADLAWVPADRVLGSRNLLELRRARADHDRGPDHFLPRWGRQHGGRTWRASWLPASCCTRSSSSAAGTAT